MSGASAENGTVLETGERARLVADLLAELAAAVPDSTALLRGSLAEGRADISSDIDLLWGVPDAAFDAAISELPVILERVRPVASLRFDPDFQHSAKRRLAFVRFAGVPLFWRVDLDLFARSAGRDPDYDRDNPSARGASVSPAESNLANAIAAIKAQRRGRDKEVAELLARAEARVGIASPEVDLQRRIGLLLDAVAAMDPTTTSLAGQHSPPRGRDALIIMSRVEDHAGPPLTPASTTPKGHSAPVADATLPQGD